MGFVEFLKILVVSAVVAGVTIGLLAGFFNLVSERPICGVIAVIAVIAIVALDIRPWGWGGKILDKLDRLIW